MFITKQKGRKCGPQNQLLLWEIFTAEERVCLQLQQTAAAAEVFFN